MVPSRARLNEFVFCGLVGLVTSGVYPLPDPRLELDVSHWRWGSSLSECGFGKWNGAVRACPALSAWAKKSISKISTALPPKAERTIARLLSTTWLAAAHRRLPIPTQKPRALGKPAILG